MKRTPSHASFDGLIDWHPPRAIPEIAYVLVKRTYALTARGLELAPPEPLVRDLRDETTETRLAPGSDFWPTKAATDVVVQGSAFAPDARPVPQMTVSLSVGTRRKAVRVFGRRFLEWTRSGSPTLGLPEPFVEMPLRYENAYGGYDGRVPVPPEEGAAFLEADHPGLYPRNMFGKGYVVLPDRVEDVELPNLEDPEDLLSPERLIVGAPELWYRQPLPCCFDWVNPLQFPRFVYLGLDAWFSPPQDEQLTEVRRGYLPPNYRDVFGSLADRIAQPLDPGYYQEASLGLHFENLSAGTPIRLTGMHPDRPHIDFTLPLPPEIDMELAGQRTRVPAGLTNVVIFPSAERVCLTYSAVATDLHRSYIPGVHAHIPLSARIDGRDVISYATPPTLRSLMHPSSSAV